MASPTPISSSQSATTRLMVIMFTDLMDSSALKIRLGDQGYVEEVARPHNDMFRNLLKQFPGATEQVYTGDGFMATFASVGDAVRCALRFHDALSTAHWAHVTPKTRVGIHLGDTIEFRGTHSHETALASNAADMTARVMSMAEGGQTLMTRAAFDSARQSVRAFTIADDSPVLELEWLAHGRYRFKGRDDPMEIFEVGVKATAPLRAPTDSEKAKRVLTDDEFSTLGWRPAVGKEIPRRPGWIIAKKLGEGGFGEVWLARQERTKEMRAFKFCFDPDRLRTFKRELSFFKLIRQELGVRDDIARLLDVQVDQPPFFLESEYVPGGNLRDWINCRGGFTQVPLPMRLKLLAGVARAVAAAHSLGIIHKDLKPSNVLIIESAEGEPRPRIADFGIGVLTDRTILDQHGITETGFTESLLVGNDSSRTGTRLYAPPEALVGKPSTTAGDVYALGVMLYQLVTGDLDRPLATGWEEEISDELLREDIRACTHRDPERRLAFAKQLADRLEKLDERRADREATARAEADRREAERRAALQARRLRVLKVGLSVALVFLLAVGGLTIVSFTQWRRAQAAQHDAEQARQGEAREGYAVRLALATAKIDGGQFNRAHEILESCPPHLRHWEWGHLRQLCDFAPKILEGYVAGVQNVMFTSDGTRLVTYDQSSGPIIWDVATGRRVASATGSKPGLGIPWVVVADDSTTVIAAGGSAIAAWDANNGRQLRALRVNGHVEGMSRDGRRVFARNLTNTVPGYTVLDSRTGQVLSSLRGSDYASNLFAVVKEPGSWVAANDAFNPRLQAVSPNGRWALFQAPNQPVAGRIETRKQLQELIDSGLRWLWTICDMESGQAVARLPESKAALGFATFSPDGTKLFTQAYLPSDNLPQKQLLSTLWETTTGRQTHQLYEEPLYVGIYVGIHKETLRAVFSADGRRLMTKEPGPSRNQVAVWDVGTGQRVTTFTNGSDGLRAVAFSADGTRAMTADYSLIQVWDAVTGKELTRLAGHVDAINCAAFSSDNRFVATGSGGMIGSSDKTARIWPLQPRRQEVKKIAPELTYAESVGFVAKGAYVFADERWLSMGKASALTIWEAETGRQVSRLEFSNKMHRVTLASNGSHLVALNREQSDSQTITEAQIWDVKNRRIRHRFTAEEMEIAPDGGSVVGFDRAGLSREQRGSGDYLYNLRVWSATNGALLSSEKSAGHEITLLADGRHASRSFHVAQKWRSELLDLPRQRVVGSVEAGISGGSPMTRFFPQQHRLLVQSFGDLREIRLMNTKTGSEVANFEVGKLIRNGTIRTSSDLIALASVAPQGERFVILHRLEGNHHVWLWETESGKHRELIGHSGAVSGAAFFPDGQRVVTAGEDSTVRLWDSVTGRELLSLVHTRPVSRVAVSPDGRSILTVSAGQGMVIWKTLE